VRYLPELRRIAMMDYSVDPAYLDADLNAVRAAMSALEDFHDKDAINANLARVGDLHLSGLAFINLRALNAWETTPVIERWLNSVELVDYQMHTIEAAVEFLERSPNVTSASCEGVKRIWAGFPRCAETTTDYRCMGLFGSLINLRRHAGCTLAACVGSDAAPSEGRGTALLRFHC
jgi:hypothetical protein